YIKTKRLSLENLNPDNRLLLNLYGEFGGVDPVRLYNLSNHIDFFADTDLVSDHAITLYTDKINRQDMAKRIIEETD
ncbi:diacylglycerol kinase, partial [Streptococcus suis]